MKAYNTAAIGLLMTFASLTSSTSVVDLDSNTYDEYLNDHSVVMVEYYAPWCGVCKELEPVYEQTAAALDSQKDIKFARVDCVAEPEICERYRVGIYPTIYAFRGLEKGQIYNGPREPAAMTRFVERRYNPVVATVTESTIEDFKNSEKVAIVAYLLSHDSQSAETFTNVAESLLDEYIFGATTDPGLAVSAGVKAPAVVLYKQFDDGKIIFNGDFEMEPIVSFIEVASHPLIGEFDARKSDVYFNKKRIPFVGIFSDDSMERSRLADDLRSIAEETKGKLNWATVDVSSPSLAKFAGKFDLKDGIWPAVAIMDSQDKYPLGQDQPINKESVAHYINDFIGGRLDPHFKAEPLPTTQEGAVAIIVRDNFKELVIDSNEDVLLEFYAPWCGHCKKLAPDYEKLASIYAKHDKQVRIAKVDATANDIPGHPVSSYPTLKFFPGKAKDFPTQYLGNRTIEHLANFVRVNSMNKIDISATLEQSGGISSYLGMIQNAIKSVVKSTITMKEDL